MGRSTVHYADNETNNILKRLHNKLRPAGTPVQRVEYIIELLLLRIFEVKLKQDTTFAPLRKLFDGENYKFLFSHLLGLTGDQILSALNKDIFPFYSKILTHSRSVFKQNLPVKIQDQLVLLEEVFANSNFTNNVKGGVVAEVIGLVKEIDEQRILKTDLLGDAIESALSETGGTKDLGLYRTPGHIRKMMVEMVDPDFIDIIFDPTSGTGGFLFDSYDFVLDKATKTQKFPPENIAQQFYRTGISGIEYLGQIRKMAAVNMYIRGLNPQNIEQGDSLKMYDPARDAGSKTVIIANPPFGAERDQPAYPNVWEEYSKESETTILFVKLMFEHLRKGGRCAVVVSEGLLTWGQNSACALRHLLLSETNLKAIISLPQGVFVSKGGQGAKTSILYFEKGQPTDFIWYYKIENDGFSMGTNRKDIEGSQIPELLTIFKELKQGKKPKDTKYSYCIPKEWIETLDPRIAERIRIDTKEKLTIKNKDKRDKLITDLADKLKNKKISQEMYDEKVWQFDSVAEAQVENEITKAIERAHTYHFNLQNYRSNLSAEQIQEWQKTLKNIKAKNDSSIENRYKELKQSDPQTGLQILASFDSKNALQMDIAREYLSKIGKNDLEPDNKLKKLEEIISKGLKYPFVSLKELIIVNEDRIKPKEYPDTEFVVLGVSNETGIFVNEKLKGNEIKQGYFRVLKNQFCYNPYRINVGSIGFNEFDFDNQIISGAYNIFGCKENELNPKYLDALLKTEKFLNYVNEKASGGVRMDFKIGDMKEWRIPLPPLEIQYEIVTKIESQKQIIEGAERIKNNFVFNLENNNGNQTLIDDLIQNNDISIGSGDFLPQKDHKTGKIPVYGGNGVQGYHDVSNYEGEVISIGRVGEKCGCVHYISGSCWITDNSFAMAIKTDKLLPRFLAFVLQKENLHQYATTSAQPSINQSCIRNLKISIPSIEIQRQIIERLDRQMQAIEGVRLLQAEAAKRIDQIINQVWSEE